MIKTVPAILVLVALGLFLTACDGLWDSVPLRSDGDVDTPSPDICEPADGAQLGHESLIAHAGGGYKKWTYTNSLEAMNNSYANGFRLIEIDWIETADSNFVGAHDWPQWFRQNGLNRRSKEPTTSVFFEYPTKGGFTPVDYLMIQKWLVERPDAILVTDKVENLEYLAANTVDLDRLIIEVFGFNKYVEALKLGLKKPMLSIHDRSSLGSDSEILLFVDSWNTQYAAVSLDALQSREDLIQALIERKVCIYSYTSNSESEMNERHKEGVHGFYTDFYVPGHWKKTAASEQ